MKKLWCWLALALFWVCPGLDRPLSSAPEPKPAAHRSPVDVTVLPGGRLALTANHTADSVSLLDLVAGQVLTEQPCGERPAAVACSRDGRRAAVSNLWAGSLSLFEVQGDTLTPAGTVPVGGQPRGLVFAPDGGSLYVALAGMQEVVQVTWPTGGVLKRWPAPGEPRFLALSRDGRSLAAVSSRSAHVRCWDTTTGQLRWEKRILEAFNLYGLALSPDGQDLVTAHLHDRHHPIAKDNIEQGWALDNRLSRLKLTPESKTDYWQIALDFRGEAVGDPCAVAFSESGTWLAVAAAGTHELVVLRAKGVPWNAGDPGDFIDGLLSVGDRLRRVPLGGRPVAVQFAGDDRAVVANYLLDSVQVVEAATGKVLRQIALGGPAEPSLARQGEAIFYDAKRSHHQWFSCHSCHPDGHTNGRSFDTLNDESYGNSKVTPTLRGVTRTGPWTWHGWQDKLDDAVEKSLTQTLFGPKPSAEDVKAVVAYLATLDHPPNPFRGPKGQLGAAARRGQAIFQGKGNCVHCHHGAEYTAPQNFDVKLDADNSPFDQWNPPTLRGVYDRGPYLHDGRAETLEEVLRSEHAPEKLGGQALTPEERQDLIEYLRSL